MSEPKAVNATQIAEFLRENLPDCQQRNLQEVVSRVLWHMRLKQVLVVTDDAGLIIGAALGRMINTLEEGLQNYVDHPAGTIVWVDLIATKRPDVLPEIIQEVGRRWPDREKVAGTVFNRNRELRVFEMKRLLQFIEA